MVAAHGKDSGTNCNHADRRSEVPRQQPATGLLAICRGQKDQLAATAIGKINVTYGTARASVSHFVFSGRDAAALPAGSDDEVRSHRKEAHNGAVEREVEVHRPPDLARPAVETLNPVADGHAHGLAVRCRA